MDGGEGQRRAVVRDVGAPVRDERRELWRRTTELVQQLVQHLRPPWSFERRRVRRRRRGLVDGDIRVDLASLVDGHIEAVLSARQTEPRLIEGVATFGYDNGCET